MRIAALVALAAFSAGSAYHLMISEVCVTPTAGEFVEIYNPTGSTVSLTNVYLCDLYGTVATVNSFYPRIVAGAVTPVADDFLVRFPSGASVPAGGVITVALSGTGFQTTYGTAPNFEILNTGVGTQMLTPANGFIGSTAGLTNGDEVLMLFFWDGTTDRCYDLDYAIWGDDLTRRIDKTGISLDGPDTGTTPTPYLNDTAPASQGTIATAAHPSAQSWHRISFSEGTEVHSGGNGQTGHDETSENFGSTFLQAVCSPGIVTTGLPTETWGAIKAGIE